MPDTQLILTPFHDTDIFCGWCPDCGLEQRVHTVLKAFNQEEPTDEN